MVFEKDLTTKHKHTKHVEVANSQEKMTMTMNTMYFCQAEPALEHNFISIDVTKFSKSQTLQS